jgi:outer membrane protein assembly factor BamB
VVYVSSFDGNLYALDARTGAKRWSYSGDFGNCGSTCWTTPSAAVANGVVYVGSFDNNVYALNGSTGAKLWSYTTGNGVDSSPAVANGVVYVGSRDGNVYALDARTGAKLWSYQTGAGHRGSAISYSVNGRQYIATPTGWQGSLVGGAAAGLFPDQEFRMGSTLVVFALPQ